MKPETIRAVVVAIVAALIFGAGWAANGWRIGNQVADIKTKVAQARADGLQENVDKLADAQARGDQLSLELAGYQQTITAFAQEKNREIERLTTGRRCLDGAVVRVLEQPAQGIQLRWPVPQAAGQPVRADGAATGDQEVGEEGEDDYATDRDVAEWINAARASYDICRGRLIAIDHFYRD